MTSSSAMYYLENDAQPEAFSDIPTTMWWAAEAMTTVGYGDLVPKTVGGKIFASITAFIGVGLIALPAGIISSGFVEVLSAEEEEAREDAEDEILEREDANAERLDRLHDE